MSGFTLLETLVTLVVLGFLVAGLAEGTRAGLRTWSMELRVDRDLEAGAAAARVLRTLIDGIDTGEDTDPLPVRGTADALFVTTDLPTRPPGGLTREATVAILLRGHALTVRWTPWIADPLRPSPAHEDVLMSDVTSVAFSYWRDGGWSDHWSGDGIPALVRVRIGRSHDDGSDVPDVVAAPFRGRPP